MEQNTENSNIQESLSLKDWISICLAKWRWFVISLIICLLAAALYILRTPPVYTRNAEVLIKEDAKGRSISSDISSTFSDLGLTRGRVNVNNEIISFQSPDLMMEVVRRLHLETEYKREARFYDRTVYGDKLPITVTFPEYGNSESAALTVRRQSDSTYVLGNFVHNGEKAPRKATVVAMAGDTTDTPVGKVVVTPTAYAEANPLNYTMNVTRSGIYGTARRFLGRLSVALANKEATVISLTASDVNTQRATEVLNMLINVYNENWIKDKNQISTSTNEFIAERLAVIESELGSVDKSISSFKSEHRLPDIVASAGMDMQLSAEANRRIMSLNNQLNISRYLLSYVNESTDKLLPANAGLEEANIQGQINQYNDILLRRNRLIESSSEENILVKDLDRELDAMRSTIATSIDNYIVALNMQLKSYRSAQSQADARISNNPRQAGQLLSDERQQKVKEALYLFLLQKREENEISQAFTAYNTRVVAAPGGAGGPIAPRKNMILLIAVLLGLAIPFALIYLLEMMNTTVRGRQDLENIAAPFLGEIPSVSGKKKNVWQRFRESLKLRYFRKQIAEGESGETKTVVVKPHSRNVINEAFRVVRTNLEFMRGAKQEGCKVAMVTSMNPGSGKTFISANLASTFAIKNKKVLAIDCDLRKKSLSYYAGAPEAGLAD
ncbi:MAG: chromosome partitioning protein ParA, partial [Bacteroidales bacterium]|nr:chromosome partitioning protein ParA [Bacteroidales bacterium]